MFFSKMAVIFALGLVLNYPLAAQPKIKQGTEPTGVELLSNYLEVYADNSKTIEDLVALFTMDVKILYQIELDYKQRRNSRFFSSGLGKYISFSEFLDAPIKVQKESVVLNVDCAEFDVSSNKCVLISGKSLSDEDWEIAIGFVEKDDAYLINYIRKEGLGGDSVSEWEQQ